MPTDRGFPILTLALALVAGVPGCGSGPPSSAGNESAAANSDSGGRGLGRSIGMEWRSLTAADSGPLAEQMARFAASPAALDPAVREAWARCEMALLVVPLAELPGVQAALLAAPIDVRSVESAGSALLGGIDRRLVTQGPRYVEVARETEPTDRTVLPLDNGRIDVRPGVLRLLARCWVEAEAGQDAALDVGLRVEIVPQWIDTPLRAGALAGETPAGLDTPESRGLTLWRLRAALTLRRDQALVMIHQRAEDRLPAMPREEAEEPRLDPGTPGRGGVLRRKLGETLPAEPAPEPDPAAGPRLAAFRSTTLGEMLLTQAALASQDRPDAERPRLRKVQILVPSLPDRYRLLGD